MKCRADIYASLLEAAGLTLNAYTFGHERLAYRCAGCGVALEEVVPLVGGGTWFWKRKFDGGGT